MFPTNPPIIQTPPPFREKPLINVFHRIRTPELTLFNFVRIIRVITVYSDTAHSRRSWHLTAVHKLPSPWKLCNDVGNGN